MRAGEREETRCAVCGEVIMNPVGRQKYHSRCRDTLYKKRGKGMTEEVRLAEARREIEAVREAKLDYLKEHCDPKCPGLTMPGIKGSACCPCAGERNSGDKRLKGETNMEYKPETVQEVVHTLGMYHSVGERIKEEYATIETCRKEAEACTVALPPLNLSGLPGGKGTTGDKTADMALTDRGRYYLETIEQCYKTIGELQAKRDWAMHAIESLSATDRRILELKLIGPKGARERAGWRPVTYTEIALKLNYSEMQVRRKFKKAIHSLGQRGEKMNGNEQK